MRIHHSTVFLNTFWKKKKNFFTALATTARTKLHGQYVSASKQAERLHHISPNPAKFRSTAGINTADISKSPKQSKTTSLTENGGLRDVITQMYLPSYLEIKVLLPHQQLLNLKHVRFKMLTMLNHIFPCTYYFCTL